MYSQEIQTFLFEGEGGGGKIARKTSQSYFYLKKFTQGGIFGSDSDSCSFADFLTEYSSNIFEGLSIKKF